MCSWFSTRWHETRAECSRRQTARRSVYVQGKTRAPEQRGGFAEWQSDDVGVAPLDLGDERDRGSLNRIAAGLVHRFAARDLHRDLRIADIAHPDPRGNSNSLRPTRPLVNQGYPRDHLVPPPTQRPKHPLRVCPIDRLSQHRVTEQHDRIRTEDDTTFHLSRN